MNVLVCCRPCNLRKRAKPLDRWLTELPPARARSIARLYRSRYGAAVEQMPLALPFAHRLAPFLGVSEFLSTQLFDKASGPS